MLLLLAHGDGILPAVANQRLRGKGAVIFYVYQRAAAKRYKINIVVAGKPVGQANALIIYGIIIHMVMPDKTAFGGAERYHRFKHFVIDCGETLLFKPHAPYSFTLVIPHFKLLHRDMEKRKGRHNFCFVAVFCFRNFFDGVFLPRNLIFVETVVAVIYAVVTVTVHKNEDCQGFAAVVTDGIRVIPHTVNRFVAPFVNAVYAHRLSAKP